MVVLRFLTHYGMHLLAPAFIARWWKADQWKQVWLVLVAANLVDLDHLLSDPIYDPTRLSLGKHLLHSWPAIAGYFLMLFHPKTRLVAIGLLWHMFTDGVDYLWVFLR